MIFRSSFIPDIPLLISSGLLGATAGISINIHNTCIAKGGFGDAAPRVKQLQTYNIIVLISAIILFILSWMPVILLIAGVPPSNNILPF